MSQHRSARATRADGEGLQGRSRAQEPKPLERRLRKWGVKAMCRGGVLSPRAGKVSKARASVFFGD